MAAVIHIGIYSTMTDHDYISAFRNDNQKAISLFYTKHRNEFCKNIRRKYGIRDEDLLSDIFQDSVIRLWRNIQDGKLTESTLTTALTGYLYGIGEKVALENLRKRKEIYRNAEDAPIAKQQILEDPYIAWLEEVEEPMRLFTSAHSHDECIAELERLTDAYRQKQHSKSTDTDYMLQNDFSAFELEERARKVRETVSRMGLPCAPLLLKFYWDQLSWEEIAQELNYSNANSAKTQKNKCMNKLKASYKSHDDHR